MKFMIRCYMIRAQGVVFSVDLVFKEVLNLMLKVFRLLVKVRWIDKDPNYLKILAPGPFNISRNKKSLEINDNIARSRTEIPNL